MVEVPDELLAEHVLTQAKEYGEYGQVHDTASSGEYGQVTHETEWELSDIDASDCTVDMDDEYIVVGAEITATYSVKTSNARYNPPGKAHPAEYENHERPLLVTITMKLGELPTPIISAE